MVRFSDLVNPVPSDMAFQYSPSDNVCYNSICCVIVRKRDNAGQPAYTIKECASGVVHDKILETALVDCCSTQVFEAAWSDFTYTGDNATASSYVLKNMMTKVRRCSNIAYGPNADNTQYKLNYYCDRDSEMKELVKNKA